MKDYAANSKVDREEETYICYTYINIVLVPHERPCSRDEREEKRLLTSIIAFVGFWYISPWYYSDAYCEKWGSKIDERYNISLFYFVHRGRERIYYVCIYWDEIHTHISILYTYIHTDTHLCMHIHNDNDSNNNDAKYYCSNYYYYYYRIVIILIILIFIITIIIILISHVHL